MQSRTGTNRFDSALLWRSIRALLSHFARAASKCPAFPRSWLTRRTYLQKSKHIDKSVPEERLAQIAALATQQCAGEHLDCGRCHCASEFPSMNQHREVSVPNAARPKGPYSPAVVFDRLLFVSGQGARVPATDQLAGPDIELQTEQCLRNVETILLAAGSSLRHVLKCSVFLTRMEHFDAMNAVYARVFGSSRPARTTVAVSELPTNGLLVEIDCIAYIP